MNTLDEIRDSIRRMTNQGKITSDCLFLAEVVETGSETISVKTGGITISDVRTTAIADGGKNNLQILPKKGSQVLCLDTGGDLRDVVVIMYSEIDEVSIMGGEHTTACCEELKKQLETLTARVDAIINGINTSTTTPQSTKEE